MNGFTPGRARLYLAAFAVWAGVWVFAVVRYGGQVMVTDVATALGLVALFVACAVICAIAWLLTRDTERLALLPGVLRGEDILRLALSWALRCWLLLLGGGLPAALRALR